MPIPPRLSRVAPLIGAALVILTIVSAVVLVANLVEAGAQVTGANLLPSSSLKVSLRNAAGGDAQLDVKVRQDSLVLSLGKPAGKPATSTVMNLGIFFDRAANEFTIPQIGRTHAALPFRGSLPAIGAVIGSSWHAEEASGRGSDQLLKAGTLTFGRIVATPGLCAFAGEFKKIIRGDVVLDEVSRFTYPCPTAAADAAIAH